MQELRTASDTLEKKLTKMLPHIDAVIVLQSVRAGQDTWKHGSLAGELERLRKALKALEK